MNMIPGFPNVNQQDYNRTFGLPFGLLNYRGQGVGVTDGNNAFGGNDQLAALATPWGAQIHPAADRFVADGAAGKVNVGFSNGAHLQYDMNDPSKTYTASDGYQFQLSDPSGSAYPELGIYAPDGTSIGNVSGDPHLYDANGKDLVDYNKDSGKYELKVGNTTVAFDATSADGQTYALNNVQFIDGDNHIATNAASSGAGVSLDGGMAGFVADHTPSNGVDVYDPLSASWYDGANRNKLG